MLLFAPSNDFGQSSGHVDLKTRETPKESPERGCPLQAPRDQANDRGGGWV